MHPSDCGLMIPTILIMFGIIEGQTGIPWWCSVSADSPIGNWTGNAGSNPADLFGSRLTRVLPNRISKLGGMSGGRERTSGTVCCSSLSIGIAVCSITQSIRVHSIINFKAQALWTLLVVYASSPHLCLCLLVHVYHAQGLVCSWYLSLSTCLCLAYQLCLSHP